MKAGLFLLALEVSAASACAPFAFCHCQGSDGSFNNSATASVCNMYGPIRGQLVYATHNYGDDTTNQECMEVSSTWNNCSWRQHCHDEGATGADSNCWCKGNCKYNPPPEPAVSTSTSSTVAAVATSPMNRRIPVGDRRKVNWARRLNVAYFARRWLNSGFFCFNVRGRSLQRWSRVQHAVNKE
jgi:hypothetical protein